MKNRKVLIGAAVVALAIAWYVFRPELLFLNAHVNEEFPGAAAAASAKVLARGAFHDVAHGGKGTATVHQLSDGKRVLRFTGFETSNGPALFVYLVAADDATDNAAVTKAGFVDLGPLKGNIGDQNYDVPADVDLSSYRAVTVWCRRFSVNFATAPLQKAGA